MKNIALSVLCGLVLAGCSQQGTGPSYETGTSTSRGNEPAPVRSVRNDSPVIFERPGRSADTSQERGSQLAFLKSIRDADPQYQTIDRAVMNEDNELGIILSKQVQMDDIPTLMRALLKQMAQRFPGENLSIVAYAPANPPLKIGTGRLDASTREMTYKPAR
jgi:hypothetical protein